MTEQQNQTAEQQREIIFSWLRDICPTGLFAGKHGNGQPYLTDSDAQKIHNYLHRNGGVVSYELLNAAITQLWSGLTWYDNSPEAANFRGPYAPDPYGGLSAEKLRQAGLKRLPDGTVTQMTAQDYASIERHSHREDSKPKTPEELMRAVAQNLLATQAGYKSWDEMPEEARENLNPWKQKAEALYVSLRSGKIDGRMTDDLRQTFVRRNGRIDWELTYNKRREILGHLDNVRNHDFRFTSKSGQ